MTYVIFEVKTEEVGKISKLTGDDLVSRQSILIRDSNSLNLKGNFSYVKIEGSTEGIKKAEEIAKEANFKKLSDKKAKEVNKKIEAQDDSAATGMGMIFD